MTVFPARPALPVPNRPHTPAIDPRRTAPPAALEPVRPSPVEWARRRRAEREARKAAKSGKAGKPANPGKPPTPDA